MQIEKSVTDKVIARIKKLPWELREEIKNHLPWKTLSLLNKKHLKTFGYSEFLIIDLLKSDFQCQCLPDFLLKMRVGKCNSDEWLSYEEICGLFHLCNPSFFLFCDLSIGKREKFPLKISGTCQQLIAFSKVFSDYKIGNCKLTFQLLIDHEFSNYGHDLPDGIPIESVCVTGEISDWFSTKLVMINLLKNNPSIVQLMIWVGLASEGWNYADLTDILKFSSIERMLLFDNLTDADASPFLQLLADGKTSLKSLDITCLNNSDFETTLHEICEKIGCQLIMEVWNDDSMNEQFIDEQSVHSWHEDMDMEEQNQPLVTTENIFPCWCEKRKIF